MENAEKSVETSGKRQLQKTRGAALGDLLLQFGEEIEGVERFQVVEVGGTELFEDSAIEGSEKDFLIAV
jgi:hypothetical protein